MNLSRARSNEKQSLMLDLLKYGTVLTFVDSRHPGVVVPEYLKGDFQLRLNFDYGFEIPDFRVLPDKLEASLSFNNNDFFCVIPFEAIYLLINFDTQQGHIFEENLPLEMLGQFLDADKEPPEPSESEVSATKTNLSTVDSKSNKTSSAKSVEPAVSPLSAIPATAKSLPEDSAAVSDSQSQAPTNSDSDKPRRGHLRLVK